MPTDPPSSDLAGLAVVIIGGTTGLGLSAATALVDAGAHPFIVGRSQQSLDTALQSLGPQAAGQTGDAASPDTAPNAIDAARSTFGRVDALYHVAGGSGRSQGDGPLHELTDHGWQFTCDLNLSSVIYSNRAAVQYFLANDHPGTILNMGSVLASSPSPHFFASHAYAATKAAIAGFTRSIASYYAPQNIRANTIAPALVETPMSQRASENDAIMQFVRSKQPLDGGRNGRATDLDAAALFLLSPASKWVTGQTLHVDGGWSVTEGQIPPGT